MNTIDAIVENEDWVHVFYSGIESIRLWATKSCGEPVSPLVSLTLPQTSTPASLPPSYHYQPTMSSTTTLASIPTSYHHLPTMSSTIPASHLSSQTMSCFRTATAHTHLPVSNMSSSYPTTTATCQAQQSTLPSAPTFQISHCLQQLISILPNL
ncbi:unnamed protein product [Mytilus edulis]|uniref:Uncharacterized protein n=1 Tax=Mytilus edulis TaxID=6550 RepID=A0A8S3V7C9_MYTED|nr:unnamed protein product [Mytilus edulis]